MRRRLWACDTPESGESYSSGHSYGMGGATPLALCLRCIRPQGWSTLGSGLSGLGPPGPLDLATAVTPDSLSIPTPGAAQEFFQLEHTGVGSDSR